MKVRSKQPPSHAKLRVAIQFYLESRSDNQITLQETVCVYPIHPVFVFFKKASFYPHNIIVERKVFRKPTFI